MAIRASNASIWTYCNRFGSKELNKPYQDSGEGTNATDRGTLWHLFMALFDKETEEVGPFLDALDPVIAEYFIKTWSYTQPLLAGATTIKFEEAFELEICGVNLKCMVDLLILRPDGVLHVVDYKFGEYTSVKAKGNKQLLFYSIMASKFFNFNKVQVHICHPNLKFGEAGHFTHTYSKDDLETAYLTLQLRIKSLKGDDTPTLGEHCRWCDYKQDCSAMHDFISNINVNYARKGESGKFSDDLTELDLKIFKMKTVITAYVRDSEKKIKYQIDNDITQKYEYRVFKRAKWKDEQQFLEKFGKMSGAVRPVTPKQFTEANPFEDIDQYLEYAEVKTIIEKDII